jgi:hypothetical protein
LPGSPWGRARNPQRQPVGMRCGAADRSTGGSEPAKDRGKSLAKLEIVGS